MVLIKKFYLLTIFIFLSYCSTTSEVYTQSGEKAYKINCSGTALSKSYCEKKARSICETNGYKKIDFREQVSPGNTMGGMSVGGFVSRVMTIQCN